MSEPRWGVENPESWSREAQVLIQSARSDFGMGSGDIFVHWLAEKDTPLPLAAWFWLEKFFWGNPWDSNLDLQLMEDSVNELLEESPDRLRDIKHRLDSFGAGTEMDARACLELHEGMTALLRARVYYGATMKATVSDSDPEMRFWEMHQVLTRQQMPYVFLSLDGDQPLIAPTFPKFFVVIGMFEERIWGRSWLSTWTS